MSALEPLTVEMDEPQLHALHVHVRGSLDLATAPVLDDQLRTALRTRRPHRVVLDLTGLTFLDCSGVAVLLRLRRWTTERGIGPPRLVGLSAPAERVLGVVAVLDQFDLDADEAIPC